MRICYQKENIDATHCLAIDLDRFISLLLFTYAAAIERQGRRVPGLWRVLPCQRAATW